MQGKTTVKPRCAKSRLENLQIAVLGLLDRVFHLFHHAKVDILDGSVNFDQQDAPRIFENRKKRKPTESVDEEQSSAQVTNDSQHLLRTAAIHAPLPSSLSPSLP